MAAQVNDPVRIDELISYVQAQHPGGDPLVQVSEAARTSQRLGVLADQLLGHFVGQARDSGATWSAIGAAMGVTKQAVHKRFEPRSHAGHSSGAGPGVITPDGCAVDFYALLPPGSEPEIIHRAAGSAGASILELGSGAGRVTHPLVRLGHRVVAIDESPEMLAHIKGAETVCCRIQDLALGRRFDVVLLASHLINVPDEPMRQALLATCARHVAPAGRVIIEQHTSAWFADAAETERVANGMTFRLKDLSRPSPDLLSATVEYQAGDRTWTQSFSANRLEEAQLQAALADAGLTFDGYLTDDHAWLRAVPSG